MKKSKKFRVATEGATVDGRTIQREWITQMADSYNPAKYRVTVNLEHIRGVLPDIRFHDLRRKSGSDADDDAHAQALLGHADPKVTRRHYRAKVTAVRPIGAPSVRQKPKR